ncbi:MAG: RNA-guided endonuclease InsQ/TnpB family protein, partial [Acidimicrobiales bacterium]
MARSRTFKFLLQVTNRQRVLLDQQRSLQRELYNAALEERRGAWNWEHRSISLFDQCRTLTGLREVRPEVLGFGVTVCRGTLKRLDRAFCAFYRRCRAGQKPGYPRFKGSGSFDSVQWEDTKGWKLDEGRGRLRIQGIGEIKVRLHRPIRGTPKAITIKGEGRRYWASIRCVEVPAEPLADAGKAVGIDLGAMNLVATSDGQLIAGPRWARRSAAKLAQRERQLAHKVRGSKRRRRAQERVAATHRSIRNQRLDSCHQLSRDLVNRYDVIVHEDLKITN